MVEPLFWSPGGFRSELTSWSLISIVVWGASLTVSFTSLVVLFKMEVASVKDKPSSELSSTDSNMSPGKGGGGGGGGGRGVVGELSMHVFTTPHTFS